MLTPIARWNYVPYQRITAATKIGVVAFSKAGITKVTFSWNGGADIDVTSPTYNSVSDTWEYWADFDPADYTDGSVTLDAVVTGDDAGARTLPQLTVIANDGGTLTSNEAWVTSTGDDSTGAVNNELLPYLTIGAAATAIATTQGGDASGGTIYLAAGTYAWSGSAVTCSTERLVIIGSSPSAVTIVPGTLSIGKYKLTGVHLLHNSLAWGILGSENNGEDIFLDNITCEAVDRYVDQAYVLWTNNGPAYFTQSTFTNMRGVAYGIELARGLTAIDMADDFSVNTPCVINCSIDGIDNGPRPDWHADGFQLWGDSVNDNIIIYNFRSTHMTGPDVHGIFIRGTTPSDGMAFVNVALQADAKGMSEEENVNLYKACAHFIMWHVTIDDLSTSIPLNKSSLTFYDADGGSWPVATFEGISAPWIYRQTGLDISPADWHFNHFEDQGFVNGVGTTLNPGDNYTTGDPGIDANMKPIVGSALINAMPRIAQVPVDIENNERDVMTSVGAYRGPSESATARGAAPTLVAVLL